MNPSHNDVPTPAPSGPGPTAVGGVVNNYEPSMSEASVLPSTRPKRGGFLKKLFNESRAYLAEYAVLLIVLGSLLGITNGLFGGIIDYISGPKPQGSWWWTDSFAYTASLSMLASVTVLVPVLIALTRRTNGSEETNPKLKDIGWRKGFLGIFLTIVTLLAICYAIGFVYTVFSKLASVGIATDGKTTVWRSLLKSGFATVLFAFTAFLFSRDYRSQQNRLGLLVRLHRYALVALALVLTVVYFFVPLKAQRGAFIDQVIVDDLRELRSQVDNYSSKNNELPEELDDLDLNNELKAHAKAYKYKYEAVDFNKYKLCAVFKTDTKSTDKVDANPLERYQYGSSSSYESPSYEDPAKHGSGEQCFNYEGYITRYDDGPLPGSYEDYLNSGANEN
jgi:hypothetical protein